MKQKKITVREAKEIAPLADVYEFKPYPFYLFIVKPSRLVGGGGVNRETVDKLKVLLNTAKIRGAFLVSDEDSFKIYELKPED